MCGIIAYVGEKKGEEIVLKGLKRLEYRGYDSWGMAAKKEGKIIFHKQVGKIGGIEIKKDLSSFSGNICMGHTRWATHGGVTAKNSHPHFSCDKRIFVVHNGIIENYQELRKKLETKSHKFISQTDTEVIVHLIEEELKNKNDLIAAVRKSLNKLEGSYAVVILDRDSDMVIGARKGSPLVMGIGQSEYFFASDVPAFLEYVNKVIFLDELEMGVIEKQDKNYNYRIINVETEKALNKKISKVEWSLSDAEKGGNAHFMIKEMLEQPEVIAKVIMTEEEDLKKAAAMIKAAKRIFVVACGTALHAGIYGSYLFAINNNLHLIPISAGEFPYFAHLVRRNDLVICVSQSGETADVLEAVRTAHKARAKVLALVNVLGSSLMRLANFSVLTKAGPEICVLSTKAFTSQTAIFLMLSFYLKKEIKNARKMLETAKKDVAKITAATNLANTKKLAKKLSSAENLYVLGRGISYANALEAALKIKEVSYIHAEGFAGGDLKHGPIALIEKGVPVIVLATPDESEKEIISNAMEVKARGAEIIGISYRNNEVFDYFLKVAKNGLATPISAIVYTQVLSYYIALEKKLDPDKPRNLAKSVTVK